MTVTCRRAAVPAMPLALSSMIGPGEYVVLAPPADMPLTKDQRAAVRKLAVQAALPPATRGAYRLVGSVDASLGPAVLLYRHGRAVIYCGRGDITPWAAAAVPVLAARAARESTQTAATTVRIKLAGCADLPEPLHPAACLVSGTDITIRACADELSSPDLAAALSHLITAQMRYLPPSRPHPRYELAAPDRRPGRRPRARITKTVTARD